MGKAAAELFISPLLVSALPMLHTPFPPLAHYFAILKAWVDVARIGVHLGIRQDEFRAEERDGIPLVRKKQE